VGDLRGGLEGLGSREATGADEVVLHGEGRDWRNAGGEGGEEALEWGDWRAGGRREYAGEDAAPQTEHGAGPTVRESCKKRRRRSVRETLGGTVISRRSKKTTHEAHERNFRGLCE
jgi:hypothetical protein